MKSAPSFEYLAEFSGGKNENKYIFILALWGDIRTNSPAKPTF